VEPDISILRKTGHFYFALTSVYPRVPELPSRTSHQQSPIQSRLN